MSEEQSSNVQGMEDKGAGSAVKDKAKDAAKQGAKKAGKAAAKSLKNGGKFAKFLFNPYVLIALAIILIILMLIGFLYFFLSMPGKVLGEVSDCLNNIWNDIQYLFVGEEAYVENTDIIEVGQYLENMGYDLESYGFGIPTYELDSEFNVVKTEQGGQKLKEDDNALLQKYNDILFQYVLSDFKTYSLEKVSFAGSESTGMLNIEKVDEEWYNQLFDNITVSRENKSMIIKRLNNFSTDTYELSLDGWSGRYGKPLELLLTLHLATMTPEISKEIATRTEFNTKVNIGLNPLINYITVSYQRNDGSIITPEQMRDAYIDLKQEHLNSLLWSQEYYLETVEQFIIDVENILGTKDELNKKGTTDKIESLLSDDTEIEAYLVNNDYDGSSNLTTDYLYADNIEIKNIIPNELVKYFLNIDGEGTNNTTYNFKVGFNEIMTDLINLSNEQCIELNDEPQTYINSLNTDVAGDAYEYITNRIAWAGIYQEDSLHYPIFVRAYGDKQVYVKGYDINGNYIENFCLYEREGGTFNKASIRDVYTDIITLSYRMKIILDEMDRIVNKTMENMGTADLGLSFQQLKEATEINYGETGSKLTKETPIQNDGKGKEVETYQPYIMSVTDAWFKDITFEDEETGFSVYRKESGEVENRYVYNPAEGSDSESLVSDENGAFWITEKSTGSLVQEQQPIIGPINENTIKLFTGEDGKIGTKDDPKYYTYDGTKRTAKLIRRSMIWENILTDKELNIELLRDFMDSSNPEEFLSANEKEIKESIKQLKSYFEGYEDFASLIEDLEKYDDILKDYANSSQSRRDKLNEILKMIINKVESIEGIHPEFKKIVYLDRSSLTAFSILENAETLDAEFILRDLKELFITLDYYTEDDFMEYDTKVLEFIVPSADYSDWPDDKVYEDEEKIEKPIDEFYTGIRQERFNVGDEVIAPGTGIITDSGEDFIKIKFITGMHVTGMEMLIEGIDVDLSNTTNITYDGKAERKIEKGEKIGVTKANKIKIYLYDEEQSIINDIEEYINLGEITNLDMVVKIDDERSPKVVTDKATLKRVIQDGWDGDSSNLTSDSVLNALLEAQEKYNVNALFLAAITIKESSAGTAWELIDSSTYNWCSFKGEYNGNYYTDTNGTKWRKYSSFAEAITDCAKEISESEYYFAGGKVWISTIAKSYCPPGTEWAEGVAEIMDSFYKNVY